MSVSTGLDVLAGEDFMRLRGKSIGLLCNQASISRNLDHAADLIMPWHRRGKLQIKALFGPEHGLWGHAQDQVEVGETPSPHRGDDRDPLGPMNGGVGALAAYSLYGENREPTAKMLDGIDLFIVDIPDVGARYYTFIWTMALCMKVCERLDIPVMVLDRPNPIGGAQVEGPVMEPSHASFVGLYPLPARHGMTVGEVATYLHQTQHPKLSLQVIRCEGWRREMYFQETGLPWAMPSPNMPGVETAVVYPGQCLLEGTNLSEGRGTTRPFEMFGAPFIDGWMLCDKLNLLGLPGVRFRPIRFQPTFNKFAGELCEGAFIHVLDRLAFEPVLTSAAILTQIRLLWPDLLDWSQPPYEYELEKRPIDILAGNGWLAGAIDEGWDVEALGNRMREQCEAFRPMRERALLYPAG